MAFNPQGPSAHDEPMADINVTPFVDVVLVLLIIFMITAGVFDFGLEIDVPQTREIAASLIMKRPATVRSMRPIRKRRTARHAENVSRKSGWSSTFETPTRSLSKEPPLPHHRREQLGSSMCCQQARFGGA